MESNNYEWFITGTVESMLPRFSDRRIGLTMKIDMSWNHYSKDGESNLQFRKEVLLVFHRPSNYTKVLYTDSEQGWPPEDVIKMKQYSDHDSCWRSDGMRWVFASFIEAWEFFEQHGIEGRNVDPLFHWSLFGGQPEHHFITLDLENPDDRWGSDYEVVIGNKIMMNEISKYMPK